jgi:hypothetical protein
LRIIPYRSELVVTWLYWPSSHSCHAFPKIGAHSICTGLYLSSLTSHRHVVQPDALSTSIRCQIRISGLNLEAEVRFSLRLVQLRISPGGRVHTRGGRMGALPCFPLSPGAGGRGGQVIIISLGISRWGFYAGQG